MAEAEWNGVLLMSSTPAASSPASPWTPPTILAVDSARFITEIRAQAEMAIAEADAVIFMTEMAPGPTAADREVAEVLRRHQTRREGC